MTCEQGCGRPARVYAIDPRPGGWGGRYCEPCAERLRFQTVDTYCERCGEVTNGQDEAEVYNPSLITGKKFGRSLIVHAEPCAMELVRDGWSVA